ncbi:MAG: efflux RND transporter periplasmic adaptor subunit [Thermoanaerobacteraceae bacterium]|nr:efflux RND transporter periplasmic adaptor subunit [Thermoanaerobacteraceae bacterium]
MLAVLAVAVYVYHNSIPEVETIRIRQGNIVQTVEDIGYVQPVTNYDLYATQIARVTRVPVEVGQPVKEGQTLVMLENLDLALQIADVRARLSQARAAVSTIRAAIERSRLELEDAKNNFNRIQELFRAGTVTQAEYDKAKLLVETYWQNLSEQQSLLENALAQVEGLNRSLEQLAAKEQQLVIKSPIDGMVLNLPVKEGQVVNPGTLLVSVALPGQLEIKAEILSDDLAEVSVGQKAIITAPILGEKTLVGKVKKIYPRAEEKRSALGVVQRRVPVIISLQEAGNLKPSYEVRVAIETLRRVNVPVVPLEAVRTTEDGRKEIMTVVNNRVQFRTVETGIMDRENIEIISGLKVGELVIRDGSLDLAENARVKPVNID